MIFYICIWYPRETKSMNTLFDLSKINNHPRFEIWNSFCYPFAWTSLLSMVNPENFMMIRWGEHSEKGVPQTDRIDGRTDGQDYWFMGLLKWPRLLAFQPIQNCFKYLSHLARTVLWLVFWWAGTFSSNSCYCCLDHRPTNTLYSLTGGSSDSLGILKSFYSPLLPLCPLSHCLIHLMPSQSPKIDH